MPLYTRSILTQGLVAIALVTSCQSISAEPTLNNYKKNEAIMQTNTITLISQHSFAQTEARLRQGLSKRGLTLFTVVDHGLGAKSVDMDIGENKLFIFGNPKAGTVLMKVNAQMGLVLPLKILLTIDNNGKTILTYEHITNAAAAHNITDKDPLLQKISQGLDGLATEVAGS